MNHAAPALSVESFAQLCALIDDGFGARADLLAAVGLDETGWRALRAQWLPRLASDHAPDLAQQFGRAYAHARRHPGFLALPEPIADDDTDVDAPAAAPGDDPMAGTMERAFPLAGPALPFRVAGLLPPAPGCYASKSAHDLPPRVSASNRADATLEILHTPPILDPVLPFSSVPSNDRRMRLQRFDTQTGQPLATPVWVAVQRPAR